MALFTALLVFLPTPAWAYLDPGTGSMLVQGIVAAIAGGLIAIKMYWAKLSSGVTRYLGRGRAEKQGDGRDA